MNFSSAVSKELNADLTLSGTINWLANQYIGGSGSITFDTDNTVTRANTFFFNVVNSANRTLEIEYDGSSTVSQYWYGGMDNYGTLNLVDSYVNTGAVGLNMSSSTLFNASGATFRTSNTSNGASFTIDGNVTNRGTMDIDHSLTVTNTGHTFDIQNSLLDIAAGQAIDVNGGTVKIDNYSGLTGTGTLNLNNVTLDIGSGFNFIGSTGTINFYGTVTGEAGATYTNNTTDLLLDNQTFVFDVNFVTAANAVTTIRAGNTGSASLTFNENVTNSGTMVLHDDYVNTGTDCPTQNVGCIYPLP